MTKGTKIFRITICVLLALTMIWGLLCGAALIFGGKYLGHKAIYDIYVAGVTVNAFNAGDILGDGTVYYDPVSNILTFNNATIESDSWPVYSQIDLNIELIGENKLICKNEVYSGGVYAGDDYLSKDLAFTGDGSLTIEIPDKCGEAVGIFASKLTINNDITVKISDCENKIHGIVCDSYLLIANKGTVTVNNGAAKNSVGVRVRGNALFEEGTKLNVAVNSGATEICKGLSVSGDIFLGKDTCLEALVDDEAAKESECVRVSGLMEIGTGSTVKAFAKNAYAVECFGAIEVNNGAALTAASENKDADVFCSGAFINYKAHIDGKLDAIGGVRNMSEN